MQFQEFSNLFPEGFALSCLQGLDAQASTFSGSAEPQQGVFEIGAAWGKFRCMVAPLERLCSRSELLVLEHGCGHRPMGTAPAVSPAQASRPGAPVSQKVKAYTTPTTTMFPSVAMMAIQSSTASLEDLGGSSGCPWPLEAACTLVEELKREYSVLKSSLGESMKAPPIMGSCAAIKDRSMVSLLPPALESSLSLPLLSSRPHSWPEKATQRAGVLETARHPRQLGGGGRSRARAVPCSGSELSAGGGRVGGLEPGGGAGLGLGGGTGLPST